MPRKYVRKTTRPYERKKEVRPPVVFKPGFMAAIDGRSELAKALRARRSEIVESLGGEPEISPAKSMLIDRLVWMEAMAQTFEEAMARGDADSAGKHVQLVNAMSGLASKLGLERRAREMPWAVTIPPGKDEEQEDGDE